jgi:hypothetical protein
VARSGERKDRVLRSVGHQDPLFARDGR